MLQVAVHDYNSISGRQFQPCENGGLLAEIAGKFRPFDPGIFFRRFLYLLKGSVPGSFADKDQLIFNRFSGKQLPQYFGGIGNILLFVISRQYNG